jgi:myo-inositol-1(or 4)-monophosphatase
MPLFEQMIHRVRKCRLMGSAALDLAYVASGRLDAYIESLTSLWDIAAGALLVQAAGGKVVLTPIPGATEKFAISATSGRIDFAI